MDLQTARLNNAGDKAPLQQWQPTTIPTGVKCLHRDATHGKQSRLKRRGFPCDSDAPRSRARGKRRSEKIRGFFRRESPRLRTPASVPAAAGSSRLCRMSPSLRAFSRRCGRCLFGAVSGHRLSSQSQAAHARQPASWRGSGNLKHPLRQVQQPGKARFNEARPQGQRTGKYGEPNHGLERNRQ